MDFGNLRLPALSWMKHGRAQALEFFVRIQFHGDQIL